MSDNRLDTPTIVNASPPFEPPLLEVAESCPRCNGVGRVQLCSSDNIKRRDCPVCRGTGHAPRSVTEDDGDASLPARIVADTDIPLTVGQMAEAFNRMTSSARNAAADALAAAARKLLTFDGDDINDDLRTLAESLRRYEEAS